MEYDHLTIENLLYRPLYSSYGCKRLEPDSKYSDLIGAMWFNCIYLGDYFSNQAKICR